MLLLFNLLSSVYIPRGQDERIRTPSRDSSFSVSSVFMALSQRAGTIPALGRIWKLNGPPRILVFGWLAL